MPSEMAARRRWRFARVLLERPTIGAIRVTIVVGIDT